VDRRTDGRTDNTHSHCALCVNSKRHLKEGLDVTIRKPQQAAVSTLLCNTAANKEPRCRSIGTSRSPETLSSRIVFLFTLMLSLFVTTSYSAVIVSLLQTSSNAITSLAELIDSPFRLSMRNMAYNTKLINVRSRGVAVS